jgi:ABC-type multidrug transport system ATPase subunit
MTSTEFIIKDLVKFYNKTKVLDIASLKLSAGQFVAIMGKNGSGKSTIMRLLSQQELFDS